MALLSGARLGLYEILAPLGQGGMGEVYRARDTKLGREVAIKVLPEAWACDADRAARFEHEAQVLAALNHPHIAALYGTDQSAGRHFLVMELVEGETLAERLERGPLPVKDALTIAHQIAEALEAAHEKGIVHRDLKPANVKITPNDQVKVLDFGLAKAMDPVAGFSPAANLTNSPTLSMMATQAGVILGTAAYMSPEQAQGLAADSRSDVFSFGSVLYEMLTGRQPFQGDTAAALLASVLVREPDLDALPPNLNPRLPELLKRCLEKNPKRRWQAVGDLRAEIETIAAAPHSAPVLAQPIAQPSLRWRRVIPMAVTAIVFAFLGGMAVWNFRPATTPPTITRFPFTVPQDQSFSTAAPVVAISPDGTQMVYSAINNSTARLYLRSMSEFEARPIPGTETAQTVFNPVFSPDGRSIAFFSGGTLNRIAVSGGAAVTICPADTRSAYGISWGTDAIVFAQGGKGIMRVSASGGKPEVLVSVKDNELAHGAQILPDGQSVLFTLATGDTADRWDRARIVVQSLKSGERKTLIEGGSDARYLPTGHIVYALGGTLFAVPFDLRRLEVTGGPAPIVEGVRRTSTVSPGSALFNFSSTGTLIYVPGPAGTLGSSLRAFVLADRTGATELLKLPPGSYAHPRVSPDGTRLAFGTDDGKEANIWIYELSGANAPRRITFNGKNRFPIWSGDGQRVAFQSDREGDLGLFWQRADGAGAAERLTKGEQGVSHVPESWARDGKRLLFTIAQGSTFTLWTLTLDERKATPFGDVRSDRPIGAVFSPDGRWVAYSSFSGGAGGGYVQPFPATGARYQIPKLTFDYHPLWTLDGKELFYIPVAGRFAAVSVQMQPSFTFGNPVEMATVTFTRFDVSNDVRNYDLTPSGKFVALVAPQEPGRSGTSSAPEIRVVLNWFEELKRLVPTRR